MELRDETALTNGTGACTVQNGLQHFYHWNSAEKQDDHCWFADFITAVCEPCT